VEVVDLAKKKEKSKKIKVDRRNGQTIINDMKKRKLDNDKKRMA